MVKNLNSVKENLNFHDNDYYYDIVRYNIRKYRRIADYTQEELAELIDVSDQYISQIERKNSTKYFTLNILGRIADALEIDIKDFFEEPKKK